MVVQGERVELPIAGYKPAATIPHHLPCLFVIVSVLYNTASSAVSAWSGWRDSNSHVLLTRHFKCRVAAFTPHPDTRGGSYTRPPLRHSFATWVRPWSRQEYRTVTLLAPTTSFLKVPDSSERGASSYPRFLSRGATPSYTSAYGIIFRLWWS